MYGITQSVFLFLALLGVTTTYSSAAAAITPAAAIRITTSTLDLYNNQSYCESEGQLLTAKNLSNGTVNYTCTSSMVLSAENRSFFVSEVLPAATERVSSLLLVNNPLSSPLLIPSTHLCEDLFLRPLNNTPEGGVSGTDFLLLVSVVPDSIDIVAWAFPCYLRQQQQQSEGSSSGAPLIGGMNINPYSLNLILSQKEIEEEGYSVSNTSSSSIKKKKKQRLVNLVVHQMLHALGFTVNFINNSFNNSLAPAPRLLNTTVRHGKPTLLVTTPKVIAAARAHYNCSTLIGMELDGVALAGDNATSEMNSNSSYTSSSSMIFDISDRANRFQQTHEFY